MYGFAITLLLAVFLAGVTELFSQRPSGRLSWWQNLLLGALAIGTAEVLQFSLFEEWTIDITGGWVGVLFTGGMMYGLGVGLHRIYEVLAASADHMEADVVPHERPRAA